jgi:hypothetical protein
MSTPSNADGPASVGPLSSSESPSSSGVDQAEFLALLRRELSEMKAEVREVKEENRRVRDQNVKISENNFRLSQQLKVAERRATKMLPPSTQLFSPPKVSSMTHSAYASLSSPGGVRHTTRVSTSGTADVGVDYEEMKATLSEEEDIDDVEEEDEVKAAPSRPDRRHRAGDFSSDADEDKEAAKLAKILSKREKPERFSGEKEKEREEVETWVDDVTSYLDSQFGQLAHRDRYGQLELQMAVSFTTGTARKWLDAFHETDGTRTWRSIKGPFIEFIRGGRESRALWMEKMQTLVYGKGKCKTLLELEKEFEQLRIKLYPTSSADPAMNEVVGRLYGDAIRRGSIDLYTEILRCLAGNEQPALSEWKSAAARGEQILSLTAQNRRAAPAGGAQQGWRHGNRFAPLHRASVNEVSGDQAAYEGEGERDEGETEDTEEGQRTAKLQQVQVRKGLSRGPPPRPLLLTTDEYRKVLDKQLCFQCYKPGHRIGDATCKEKGQKKRKPTKEELNA